MLLIYNFFYFLSFCVSFRFIQFSRFPHVGKTRWRPEENGSSIAWLQRLHYNGKLGRNRAVLWWQHGHFARLARLEPCTQWGNGNGRWTRGIPPGVQKEKEQNKTETPANWARKHKKKKTKVYSDCIISAFFLAPHASQEMWNSCRSRKPIPYVLYIPLSKSHPRLLYMYICIYISTRIWLMLWLIVFICLWRTEWNQFAYWFLYQSSCFRFGLIML